MTDFNHLFAQRVLGTPSSIVRDILDFSKMPHIISLAGGIPAPDMFDIEGIDEALKVAASFGIDAYQYSLTPGEVSLRDEIAKLLEMRNITTNREHLVVTNGSQQALDLVARSFLDEKDIILVGRPTYLAALQVFSMLGATMEEIDETVTGPDLDALEKRLEEGAAVKALYIVPTFANPTGYTMSEVDRLRLIDLAVKYRFIIIEDDPYGEIRFEGERVPSIYQLAQDHNKGLDYIIYLSSFSKILVPGLRLGFVVAHPEIINKVVLVKQSVDLHTPVLPQLIVASYLESGRIKERIPAISKTYGERCYSLMRALDTHLSDKLTYNRPEGGMFLWGHLKNNINSQDLLKIAAEEGVVFVPGSAFYVKNPDLTTLRLSFATINEEGAEEAAKRLAKAIKRYENER